MNLMIWTGWSLPWRNLFQLFKQKLIGITTIVMVKAVSKFKKLEVLLFTLWEDKTLELISIMPMENQLKFLPFKETSTSTKLTFSQLHGQVSTGFLSWTLLLKEETWHLEETSVVYPHQGQWKDMELSWK